MTGINRILSHRREIHEDETGIVTNAEENGLCRREKQRYVLCANPSDPDYEYIPDRNCMGEINLKTENDVCPNCQRNVTEIPSKEILEKEILFLNKGGIRDFVRNSIKQEHNTAASTVKRKYCGRTTEYVLELDSLDAKLFIFFKNSGRDYLRWCKIYDENPVLLLVDEALPLKKEAEAMRFPYFTLEDIFPDITTTVQSALEKGKTSTLTDRGLKGQLAHQIGTNESILEEMKYDDFEHVVQSLLVGAIGNSQMLGATESGSGVPDGTLSLHFQNDDFLYMWDAKFVKYAMGEENKTELADEYDKIFRHLGDMENRRQVKKKFGGVQGIILFSPGIKEANIVRLAEFINERQLLNQEKWTGTICYFSFGALTTLYRMYVDNQFDVRMKEEAFRTVLHSYLSSKPKHGDDPKVIKESLFDCIHMSKEDVHEIYRRLAMFEPEEEEFNVKQHMAYLDLVTN